MRRLKEKDDEVPGEDAAAEGDDVQEELGEEGFDSLEDKPIFVETPEHVLSFHRHEADCGALIAQEDVPTLPCGRARGFKEADDVYEAAYGFWSPAVLAGIRIWVTARGQRPVHLAGCCTPQLANNQFGLS